MSRPTSGQNVPKSQGDKFRRESSQTGGDTLGQSVPKGGKTKFHRKSAGAKTAADKFRHEDAAGGGAATDTPPKGNAGAGKSKLGKDAERLQKSKLHMEKSGEKLNAAKEKLAAQKPIKKRGPVKKAGRAVSGAVQGYVHTKIFQVEDENVGVEGAHRSELVGEAAVRGTSRFVKRRIRSAPARAVRRAESKNFKATADYQFRKAAGEHPEFNKNAVSRLWQKMRLKKQYQKQARAAAKQGAKAAGETTATAGRAVVGFIRSHPVGALLALVCVLLVVGLQSCASSLVTVGNGMIGAVAASTYPAEDGELLGAEAAYAALEAELQNDLDSYESTHSYDEYHFDLDEIKHDPYNLLSILCALHEGGWTVDEVRGTLEMLFHRQYVLTEHVVVETRYYTETGTDTDGNEYEEEVPYDYSICSVTLKNNNLSHLPMEVMNEEQLSRYSLYMATLGNRPDLFPDSPYVGKYGPDAPPAYEIPPEALEDETFAAMMAEATKYIGYPYVWGGSSPSTSFDCSGFVSWVINHSGWNVGRLGAQGLYNYCTPVREPRPGDLIFFKGTYDTPGVSHCGIYVGNSTMLHCGDPIKYSNINTSYWQSHFFAYGRLP